MYSGISSTEYVSGNAVYDSATDAWRLTYFGSIPGAGTCEMYFFDPSKSVASIVSIDENTVVYEDLDATYKKNDKGDIIVHARLEPKTGRVRFQGEANTAILVNGLTFLSGYDVPSNTFSSSAKRVSLTVGQDGFTPYLYATSDVGDLHVVVGNASYSKTFSGILNAGKSGVIKIPYPWSYTGWTGHPSFETFTVNGVTFRMNYVAAGTFLMGATEEQENPFEDEFPVHKVTLTKDYFLGETVVTQALWEAVMGSYPYDYNIYASSNELVGTNKPMIYIDLSYCSSFMSKLSELTGKKFRFPTEAEWEYAARGGFMAEGCQYSGGANIDDYAWYGNCDFPDVKSKLPNALGLYDMSGCVWEWCVDWYRKYSSDDMTDPIIGEEGGHIYDGEVLRGGCYQDVARYCRTSARYSRLYGIGGKNIGLRLAF